MSTNHATYTTMSRIILMASIVCALCGQPCHAYLGGFEVDDGYVVVNSHIFTGEPDYDVAKYNAGQYGVNVNNPIPASNTYTQGTGGLWSKRQGALMPSNTDSGSTNPRVVYATSHNAANSPPLFVLKPFAGQRSFVMTTNNQGWSGAPQEYSYQIDAQDLGGVVPSTTANDIIDISFWSCSQLWGSSEGGGLTAGAIGNSISFLDSSLQGFQVGYIQPGTTTDNFAYNLGNGWVGTGIPVPDPKGWHRWDISLDLDQGLVSISYTEALQFQPNPLQLGNPVNLVTSAPIAMGALKELRFLSTAGVNNGKFWALDDFSFQIVPEPGSLTLILVGCLGSSVFYRRRHL